MILACTVFDWFTRVTDGWTDRQTDRQTELRWLRRAIAVVPAKYGLPTIHTKIFKPEVSLVQRLAYVTEGVTCHGTPFVYELISFGDLVSRPWRQPNPPILLGVA